MGIESIIGEAGKALLESESAIKIGTEVFKRDAEVLAGFSALKTPELTESIAEHLINEGRPGSAEYMNMFSKSCCLDKELSLLEAGIFDPQAVEQGGLPVLIDAQQTTPEMISDGQAVLTPEARADFLGCANTLKYKLNQHISKTAQTASHYYSSEFTREKAVTERLREVLGIKPEPYEIPFVPNEAELKQVQELSRSKFINREEAKLTFRRELQQLMKQRPGSMGLDGTFSFSKFVGELSQELGGDPTKPINIERLRSAHILMTGRGAMEELQIYSEFGNAIKEGIERDFSQLNTASGTSPNFETVNG
ncbi:MAG: hypothetical protein ACOZAO_00090 [Patescibacteria group bacterium]